MLISMRVPELGSLVISTLLPRAWGALPDTQEPEGSAAWLYRWRKSLAVVLYLENNLVWIRLHADVHGGRRSMTRHVGQGLLHHSK